MRGDALKNACRRREEQAPCFRSRTARPSGEIQPALSSPRKRGPTPPATCACLGRPDFAEAPYGSPLSRGRQDFSCFDKVRDPDRAENFFVRFLFYPFLSFWAGFRARALSLFHPPGFPFLTRHLSLFHPAPARPARDIDRRRPPARTGGRALGSSDSQSPNSMRPPHATARRPPAQTGAVA